MTIKKLQDTGFCQCSQAWLPSQEPEYREMLMLIVSELSEALEADRKGRHFKKTTPSMA